MKRKNYQSDFVAKLVMPAGKELEDFELEFSTNGIARYKASRIGDTCKNCVMVDDGSMLIIFKNHGLGVGRLNSTIISWLPSEYVHDGKLKEVYPRIEDIELVDGASDDSEADIKVLTSYAIIDAYDMAVANGYQGSAEDYINALVDMPSNVADAGSATKLATDAASKADAAANDAEVATGNANTAAAKADAKMLEIDSILTSKADTGAITSHEDYVSISTNQQYGVYNLDCGISIYDQSGNYIGQVSDGGENNLCILPARANGDLVMASTFLDYKTGQYIVFDAYIVDISDNTVPGPEEEYPMPLKGVLSTLVNHGNPLDYNQGVLHLLTSGAVSLNLNGDNVTIDAAGEHTIPCPKGSMLKILSANVIGIYRFDGTIKSSFDDKADIVFINNTAIEVYDMGFFYQCSNLETMDNTIIRCLDSVDSLYGMFRDTHIHNAPYIVNTAGVTSMSSMYEYCYNLATVPLLDTSRVTSFKGLFNKCYGLITVPKYDTSKATNIQNMFSECRSMHILPDCDFSKATNMVSAFALMSNITEFPGSYNFGAVVNATYAWAGDWGFYNEQKDTYAVGNLRRFPAYSMPECTTLTGAWQDQTVLYSLGKLNIPKCINIDNAFNGCFNLTNVGGFTGLKCNINMSHCSKLTTASMVNIMTEAADVTALGQRTMTFGAVNLAKLTDAQKAIATEKGWTLL